MHSLTLLESSLPDVEELLTSMLVFIFIAEKDILAAASSTTTFTQVPLLISAFAGDI
jgi:hypothetical protein